MSTDPTVDCKDCTAGLEADRWDKAFKAHEEEEAKRQVRNERNRKARVRYWQPENITKRREQRAEQKRLAAEAAQKRLAEAFRIVGDMMRGR